MATVTATYHGTPNINPYGSQNTAPVREHRCLFTHDIRKKSKKWHDGSLRFHTFNRRVMVYDDAKNYVGDLHYRQEEEFDEGTELQLDRGVLVEVGERVGETQTDLAPLLDRRKPEDDASKARTTTQRTRTETQSRQVSLQSQQRPKSLMEVLGASQARTGRTRLPLQSPYEQRQNQVRLSSSSPPLKRQRIAPGKENSTKLHHTGLPGRISTTVEAKKKQLPCIVELSSSDESSQHPSTKNLKLTKVKSKSKIDAQSLSNAGDFEGIHSGKALSRVTSDKPSKTRVSKGDSREKGKPEKLLHDKSSASVSIDSCSRPNTLRPGMTQLRLISQAPRKKLMYKALLPSFKAKENHTRASGLSPNTLFPKDQHGYLSVGEATPDALEGLDSLDDFHHETVEIISVQSPQSTRNIHHTLQRVPSPSSQHSQHSSPLFFPESTDYRSQANNLPLADEDLSILQGSDISRPDNQAMESIDKPVLQKVSRKVDRVLMPPPTFVSPVMHNKFISSTPREASLQKSWSESDVIVDDDIVDEDMLGMLNAEDFLQRKRTSPALVKSKSPLTLQRSVSDPTTMAVSDIDDPAPLLDVTATIEKQEQGPWTSVEAFLLFDWWPPNRQKPQFDGPLEAIQPAFNAPKNPSCFITTARDMLRDDRYVL